MKGEKEFGKLPSYSGKGDNVLSMNVNNTSDVYKYVLDKINEIKLYRDQGLDDIVKELVKEIIDLIETNPQIGKDARTNFLLLIEDEFKEYLPEKTSYRTVKDSSEVPSVEVDKTVSISSNFFEGDPGDQFNYAKNLMSIHGWEEAINIFKLVAATGYRVEECYEYCGDCAYKLGRYQEALEYYQIVYNLPDLGAETRKRIFDKIVRCRQRKFMDKLSLNKGRLEATEKESSLLLVYHLDNLSKYVGEVLKSWEWQKELPWAQTIHSYRVGELLQVGNTWAVFEVSRLTDDRRFVALTLNPSWWSCVKQESFVDWCYINMMMDSEYLAIPDDLAVSNDGTLFIIRTNYDYSLVDYLANRKGRTNIDEALAIGYQILEGLGYLHLHLAKDKQKRKIYHLDLRPSRVFFTNRGRVVLAYGGLWHMLTNSCPHLTSYRMLPLSFLSYRAPEQFRSYLWSSKKPLVCTDVYQFGVLFYEILTGVNPFTGESVEEIEMLHCDQKPIPPQVVRPDLPEELSELIMNCLHTFPAKRWRSTTQILLAVEKMLGGAARIREIMVRREEAVDD